MIPLALLVVGGTTAGGFLLRQLHLTARETKRLGDLMAKAEARAEREAQTRMRAVICDPWPSYMDDCLKGHGGNASMPGACQ